MEEYSTKIKNYNALFTDDYLKIENLTLPYDKMSDINCENKEDGTTEFTFKFGDKTIAIPCNLDERSKLMPFFAKAAALEKQRKEQELLSIDDLEVETPAPVQPETKENSVIEEIPIEDVNDYQIDREIKNKDISNDIIDQALTQSINDSSVETPMNSEVVSSQDMISEAMNSNTEEPVASVVAPQVENSKNIEEASSEIKPFCKIGRLIAGIVAMLISGLITFQSCAAGLANALGSSNSISGTAGFMLSLFILAGGIVGIAARKSVRKRGGMIPAILFALGSFCGALEWHSTFSDLRIWVIVSLIFSLFYAFCAFMTKTKKSKKHIVVYIIYGLILFSVIGGIAFGGNLSNNTPINDQSTIIQDISTPKEQTKSGEYKAVSADDLLKVLDENAMKAKEYEGQNLAVKGKLLTIDSDGAFITLDAVNDDTMRFSSISCNIKTDKQKEKIKTLASGNEITVKGKMISVGEVMGYEMDIDSIE